MDDASSSDGRPLVVDEVQYAPRLLRFIKSAADAERDRPGQFLLTGSQKFSRMEGVTESLSCRCWTCTRCRCPSSSWG